MCIPVCVCVHVCVCPYTLSVGIYMLYLPLCIHGDYRATSCYQSSSYHGFLGLSKVNRLMIQALLSIEPPSRLKISCSRFPSTQSTNTIAYHWKLSRLLFHTLLFWLPTVVSLWKSGLSWKVRKSPKPRKTIKPCVRNMSMFQVLQENLSRFPIISSANDINETFSLKPSLIITNPSPELPFPSL